ncbi:hypothetical protein [Actinosynnema sp. NPDC020468]|uniref:hypothetical protein n=1 Tax=Actinosynnema sp. NPDC020468 TaxID=3154488 RepID=UPI0033EAAE84
MKRNNKFARALLATVLGLCLVSAGTAVGTASAATGAAAQAPGVSRTQDGTITSRDLIRGVFFGHGPVGEKLAAHFPNIGDAAVAQEAEDTLITELERRHGDLVDEFYTAFTSRSVVKTKAGLLALSGALDDTVESLGSHGENYDQFSQKCAILLVVLAEVYYVFLWVDVTAPPCVTRCVEAEQGKKQDQIYVARYENESKIKTDNLVLDLIGVGKS